MGVELQIAAAAAPRRVEALACIIESLRRGKSPSYEDLGRAMNPAVSGERARIFVAQLVKLGVIGRDAGSHRGIYIRDFEACRTLIDTALGKQGWHHAGALAPLSAPYSLLNLPVLPLIELPDALD